MQVHIIYFASVRDALGRGRDVVSLEEGATVAALVSWLERERSKAAYLLPTVRVAVNREFVRSDHVLNDGDELVLVPPISGGSGSRVALTHEPIAPGLASTMISEAGAGAISSFTGVVRPTSKGGRDVSDLFYEAYEPMALEKLQLCLDEAAAKWTVIDAAVVHRLGTLTLGEVAVSIAVSSAHRKEAIRAVEYIIDRIKEIVPIWKKETGPDGSEWVSEGA